MKYETYQKTLCDLKEAGSLRKLAPLEKKGKFVFLDNKKYLNLSSNDYLGIAADENLREEFLKNAGFSLGSTSSRLLTGTSGIFCELENYLAKIYQKDKALLFNSGYHANAGIMSCILTKKDVVFCDKLNHASILDGIRLSNAQLYRFKHLDYKELEKQLEKYREKYENAIIVTESLFSMDGDCADLDELIRLKEKYSAILIVDDAHAFGVYGENGLGLCEKYKAKIDLITSTFGKSAGSVGAFCAGDGVLIDYLINKARSFIFSTALSDLSTAFNLYVVKEIFPCLSQKRAHLFKLSKKLHAALQGSGFETKGGSYIVPVVFGSNQLTNEYSKEFLKNGYYLLPIRHPTVAKNQSRVRISLRADVDFEDIDGLLRVFDESKAKAAFLH